MSRPNLTVTIFLSKAHLLPQAVVMPRTCANSGIESNLRWLLVIVFLLTSASSYGRGTVGLQFWESAARCKRLE